MELRLCFRIIFLLEEFVKPFPKRASPFVVVFCCSSGLSNCVQGVGMPVTIKRPVTEALKDARLFLSSVNNQGEIFIVAPDSENSGFRV